MRPFDLKSENDLGTFYGISVHRVVFFLMRDLEGVFPSVGEKVESGCCGRAEKNGFSVLRHFAGCEK
jgi:hypothetical protein